MEPLKESQKENVGARAPDAAPLAKPMRDRRASVAPVAQTPSKNAGMLEGLQRRCVGGRAQAGRPELLPTARHLNWPAPASLAAAPSRLAASPPGVLVA